MTPEQIRARGLFAIRALDAIEARYRDDNPRGESQRRERVVRAVRIYSSVLIRPADVNSHSHNEKPAQAVKL
jgi:hypothetical protein